MKKRISKILCLTLATTMAITAFGCDCGGDSAKETPKDDVVLTYTECGDYTGGLHVYNKTKTNDYILKDGKTEYVIVKAETSNARATLAYTDFRDVFMKSTGRTLSDVSESAVNWSADQKYIVLGSKKLQDQAGLTLSDKINANGFQIKTAGKSVFVMAEDSAGVLFGAHELLTQLLNYERYSVDYYTVDENVKDVPLYDFDITDNPDFERRIGPWGSVYTDVTNAGRMRFLLQYQDVYVNSDEYPAFHNTLEALPPATYLETNPEWYAQEVSEPSKVRQLCYTAHGSAEKYESMVNTMANVLIRELTKDTVRNIITMTQEDNTEYCTCDKCKANQTKYGGLSGSMFIYLNDVARVVNRWIDENQTGRKVLIAMFAYQTYQLAPATQDANGVWHPVDDAVVGLDNTAVFFAPSTANYAYTFNQEENKDVKKAIDGWQVCAKNVGTWMYQTTYDNYFLPFDNFSSMQDNYKSVLNMGSKWIFDQGQQGNKNLTAFNNFKLYLNSKWQWNVNLDYNELYNSYFDSMYGPASATMKDFFLSLRMHLRTLKSTDVMDSFDNANNFPLGLVRQWIKYCETAYGDLEAIKTSNPELYKVYYDNVVTESIMARHMLIKYYPGSVSPEQLKIEKSTFKEDCLRLNFTEHSQHNDINELLKDY